MIIVIVIVIVIVIIIIIIIIINIIIIIIIIIIVLHCLRHQRDISSILSAWCEFHFWEQNGHNFELRAYKIVSFHSKISIFGYLYFNW